MKIIYPFIPKSTSYLEEGQIISIPLDNGKYACGQVLQFEFNKGKKDSRSFLIGLLNWSGDNPPNSSAVLNSEILVHGQVHIKTIKECGAQIVDIGKKLDIPLSLDESPGQNCHLRRGFDVLGIASEDQQKKLKVFATWGYRVLKIKAEKYLGQ